MRHRIKKIKFTQGADANRALERKLVRNFIENGKIVSTQKKIRFLKQEIQRLVEHAKRDTQSSHNYLLKKIGDGKTINFLKSEIRPLVKDRVGGYVKNVTLPQRASDGSRLARLEWVVPVVKKEPVVKKAPLKKSASKQEKEVEK